MNLGSNYNGSCHFKLAYVKQKQKDKRHDNIFVDIPRMTFSYKSIKSRSGVIHLGVVTVDVFWSFCSCWSALGALESK